jgi:hypothetical protein
MQQILAFGLAVVLSLMGWGIWVPPVSAATADAEAIFREAYTNRYTWDNDFPGYRADVTVASGDIQQTGAAELMADFGVSVKGIDNEETQRVVVAQLQMSATHLQRLDFEKIHQQRQFKLTGLDQAGAYKIQELGDGASSSYKVKAGKIAQVNRNLGDFSVEVNTLDTEMTPSGYLATHFQVTFRDSAGKTLEQDDVHDEYKTVGHYRILAKRQIQAGEDLEHLGPDVTVSFGNIQLNQPTQ